MVDRGKRGRSRKHRSRAGAATTAAGATPSTGPATAPPSVQEHEPPANPPTRVTAAARVQTAAAQRRAQRLQRRAASGSTPVSRRFGERPRPAWHPLPLAELLILVGAIGVAIGFGRGVSHGGPPLFAGIAAVAIGTLEVTLREHRSGYRSHTALLAALPVVVFHSVIALVVTAFTTMPAIATVGLLALDLVLFVLLFKLLRTRFLTVRTRAAGRH